jgi:hypothetical protein
MARLNIAGRRISRDHQALPETVFLKFADRAPPCIFDTAPAMNLLQLFTQTGSNQRI